MSREFGPAKALACLQGTSVLIIIIMIGLLTDVAAAVETSPFRVANQGPLMGIFGIPADQSPEIAKKSRFRFSITQDIANSFISSSDAGESLLLDGESYRWTASARFGVSDRTEIGIEIPLIVIGGGFFDGFIEGWHSTFGLENGGRNLVPKDRLSYRYTRNGSTLLDMNRGNTGIGDIVLGAGFKLYDDAGTRHHDQASLKASLKLPTGDSGELRGSGSVDFSVLASGSMSRVTEWGGLAVFGSIGGMVMSDGDVIRSQQENLAAFGTAGLGWSPAEWLGLKVQLNWNTPLYHGSSLNELSGGSAMLVSGGTLKLPADYFLDIGVSEDVAVGTAPDIGLHLSVSRKF